MLHHSTAQYQSKPCAQNSGSGVQIKKLWLQLLGKAGAAGEGQGLLHWAIPWQRRPWIRRGGWSHRWPWCFLCTLVDTTVLARVPGCCTALQAIHPPLRLRVQDLISGCHLRHTVSKKGPPVEPLSHRSNFRVMMMKEHLKYQWEQIRTDKADHPQTCLHLHCREIRHKTPTTVATKLENEYLARVGMGEQLEKPGVHNVEVSFLLHLTHLYLSWEWFAEHDSGNYLTIDSVLGMFDTPCYTTPHPNRHMINIST